MLRIRFVADLDDATVELVLVRLFFQLCHSGLSILIHEIVVIEVRVVLDHLLEFLALNFFPVVILCDAFLLVLENVL